MDFAEQNKLLADMRQRFLSGTLSEYAPRYERVVAGWRKSLEAGTDPGRTALTDVHRDFHVFDRIDDLSKCHLAYFKDYYESRSAALEKLGCAIFYLDTQLAVFHKSGNRALLAELKRRGLRTGTVLSVENVGSFAGNAALEKPFSNCFTAGSAHFSAVLADYACLARYGEAAVSQGFHAVNVIFIPLAHCYKSTLTSASFMLEAGDFTYKNRILYPHIERRFRLLEQSVQYSTDPMLLVDDAGEIVFMNSRFEHEFGLTITDSIGRPLAEQLPPLAFLLKALRSGREISERNVMIPDKGGAAKAYYAECLPMWENRTVTGLKITLKTAEQIRRYSAVTGTDTAVCTFSDIIAKGPAMEALKEQARIAAGSSAAVLITGETGTGKELFAQAIHNAGRRAGGPFVPINCGALPLERAGPELFGFEAGFLPGSASATLGKLEQADGGTLFLDDVSELPPDMQTFLLRFLEDGVVTRTGGTRGMRVNVRVVAATSKDLLQCAEKGSFRPDLYYRLNVLRLDIPPLRQRPEELALLTERFVSELSAKYGKNIFEVTPETLQLLRGYAWPGNLRELRNLLERFLVSAPDGRPLNITGLPEDMPGTAAAGGSAPSYVGQEQARIRSLLLRYNGNKSRAARELGMSRGTLYKRLADLHIE